MNDGIIGTACVGIAHHGFRLRSPCIAGHPLHGAGFRIDIHFRAGRHLFHTYNYLHFFFHLYFLTLTR